MNEWAEGVRDPNGQTQRRLRLALQIAQTIAEKLDAYPDERDLADGEDWL